MSEKEILIDISKKLDRIIALSQIGLRNELDALRVEIRKDDVSLKILEYADGTLSSGELREKVANVVDVSEKTVERRVSDLIEQGLLISNRTGKSKFYLNSGIIEV